MAWCLHRPPSCKGPASHLGCSSLLGVGTRSPFSPPGEELAFRSGEREADLPETSTGVGVGGGVLHQLSPPTPSHRGNPFLTLSALGQVNPFDGQPPTWEPSCCLPLTGINKDFALQHHRLFEPHCTDGKPRPREGGREDGLRLPSGGGRAHSTRVPSSQVLSPPPPGSDGSESNSGQILALSGDGTTLVIFKVTEQQNEGDTTTSPD